MTRPTEWAVAGSTIGMALTFSVRPRLSANFAGMMLAHRPVRTWANNTIMEFDSSVGDGSAPGAKQTVDNPTVLHGGREQTERDSPDLGPGDGVAISQRPRRRGQKPILFQ